MRITKRKALEIKAMNLLVSSGCFEKFAIIPDGKGAHVRAQGPVCADGRRRSLAVVFARGDGEFQSEIERTVEAAIAEFKRSGKAAAKAARRAETNKPKG